MVARVVIAEFDGGRQSFQHFELRLLELASTLGNLALELEILITQSLIQELCLQQVANPQQYLGGIERLANEILGAESQRAVSDIGAGVGGNHQNGKVTTDNVRDDLLQNLKSILLAHVTIEQHPHRLNLGVWR